MSHAVSANAKRHGLMHAVVPARVVVEPKKKRGLGRTVAGVLGVAAAVGVLYAAWQALRTDDELWVADDPLSTPNA